MSTQHGSSKRSLPAAAVRKLAVLVILGWVAVTVLVNVAVPTIEQVAKDHAASLSNRGQPSVQAMMRTGEVFNESSTDSVAVIVLEGEEPLGDQAHRYYDDLIRQLKTDTTHVQHVQDFWGDPLTAPAVQSGDGEAVYVQVNLAGNQGEPLANESVQAVRDIIAQTPAPDGVKAYVTGPSALVADMNTSGEGAALKITVATVAVISIMLLLVYRSITTVALLLSAVGVLLGAVRGIVAFLGHIEAITLSTFSISILISLALAAGTDYGIFFVGRYHEARQAGEDREAAYFTAYRSVAHVILASGLTIAGATLCLSFTRLPIFQTMGAPCAVGMLVAIAIALTLIPAIVVAGSRFGLLDPKRRISVRGWRRVGTAVVRWPGPIFVASCAVALVGLLALPGYQPSFKDRLFIPQDTPSNIGWAAAERHFSEARMTPEVLMVESDHDMRNSSDFLVLNKLAKAIFGVQGVAGVQAVTRPEGTPLEHTSIPFLLSLQNAGQLQNLNIVKSRISDLQQQADELAGTIATLEHASGLMQQLTDSTHHTVGVTKESIDLADELRDNIADFDDFFRPIRNYFYWEPHCFDIPICWALRSAFQATDSADEISEKLNELRPDLDNIDAVLPQLAKLVAPQSATMKSIRAMMLTMHSTMSGIIEQMEELGADATAMGQDFDAAQNDDSFYLPRAAFDNPIFQRVMDLFLSPDGKAARFIITHKGDPASEEGIERIDAIKTAAEEALKGTPLANADIYVAGTAAIFKDLQHISSYDLMIAGTAALCIIFLIMLMITRSFVAPLMIVGTVVASLGASFGLSVLLWQYLIGFNLHWFVLGMSVIILLAVGSDYNLLLVARFKEEVDAGLKTGLIRAMGGTGRVVTAAGLVFAFTMAAMVVSDLRVVGQVGTTIGLGLLFDTLIVRSFMMPSSAALLGRWFWWPLNVPLRPPPARHRAVSKHRPDDGESATGPETESTDETVLR
jgi:RND superfamily putative drug exporter